MNIRYIYPLLLLSVFFVSFSNACSNSKEILLIATSTPVLGPVHILEESREAMSSVKSYQFDLSHRMGNGSQLDQSLTLVNALGSVSRGGGISLESDLLFGNIPVSAGVVKTKDSTYLRDPLTQKWQVWPGGSSPFDFLDPDKMITSILDGLSGPTLLSSRNGFFKISGQIATSSFDYIFQDTLNEEANLTVWIDSNSFVITRVEIVGRISEMDPNEMIRVLEISRFDEVLEIVTPEIK